MRQAATIVDYVTLIDWAGIDKADTDPVIYGNEKSDPHLFHDVLKRSLEMSG